MRKTTIDNLLYILAVIAAVSAAFVLCGCNPIVPFLKIAGKHQSAAESPAEHETRWAEKRSPSYSPVNDL